MVFNPYYPRREIWPGGEKTVLRGWGWFYVPSWNLSIVAPPKSGSSSLKNFFSNSDIEHHYVLQNQVPRSSNIHFVVRDPIARFASLWKSKCRDKRSIQDTAVHGLSPSELVEFIKSGKRDVHWTPQHKMIAGLEEVNLIALEKLNEWWSDRGYGELEIINSTESTMPMDQTIRDWIHDFYAEDFILYSKACGFS